MASNGDDDKFFCIDLIKENSEETILECTELLLKFADHILKSPKNEKYRRIRVANPIVESKLIPVSGCIECLFEMGFEEDGDYFTMPMSSSLGVTRAMRDELQCLRDKVTSTSASSAEAGAAATAQPSSIKPCVAQTSLPRSSQAQSLGATSHSYLQSEATFFSKLESGLNHVLIYEDPSLQQKARDCMPVKQLKQRATDRRKIAASDDPNSPLPDLEDFLVLELLAWFKRDFFSWMDKPPCEKCDSQNVSAVGSAPPTAEELRYGGHRVENYMCQVCSSYTRFPRFNHPGKLLETRRGRCGEWANCFTLCCRALGYDARHAVSWTDHVWTEVFSRSQNRWLHCDPCENVCDKPLLYEAGWGTKMTYVIAYSVDDIQDVTWRYSAKHEETRSNRTECRESWLVNTILKLRKKRQANSSTSRKKELDNRVAVELCEFLVCKKAGEGELSGRISGSQAWRDSRGESGSKNPVKSATVTPTQLECNQGMIELRYNSASDVYMRGKDSMVKGWANMVFSCEDIARKEELDWKMVYLSRRENTDKASITWKFDLTGSGHVIDRLEVVSLTTTCYEDGQVSWRACYDDQCSILQPAQTPLIISECDGSTSLSLTADLRRGQGQTAWQHTQLFRQSLDDSEAYPFFIKLYIKPQSK